MKRLGKCINNALHSSPWHPLETSGQPHAQPSFYSKKKPPVLTNGSLGGPLSRSEHAGEEKNFALTGYQTLIPRYIQSVPVVKRKTLPLSVTRPWFPDTFSPFRSHNTAWIFLAPHLKAELSGKVMGCFTGCKPTGAWT
jgi:hypothetical protein